MKFLEKFTITFNDYVYDEKQSGIFFPSVNSMYSFNWKWDVVKNEKNETVSK